MTVSWAIELDTEPVERVRADLLVVPLFEGERPLRGPASRIDWRLCGHLSEMVAREAVAGAADEVVLVPSGSRLRAPRALLLGAGPREGFAPKLLRGLARRAVESAASLRAGIVAIALPAEGECGVPAERAAAAVLIGAGEALAERPFPLRLRLIVEPAGLSRARFALAELVPRIDMQGVTARLTTPETSRPAHPVGVSHHLDDEGLPRSPSQTPSAKLPSLP
jgi:Cytosol aminopeptidase family, N-terminal domain